MKINKINTDKNVFIIAEIGNNHEGSLSLAKKMIKAAKFSGADAVKFQTIIPKKLVEESDILRIKQLKKFELSKANYAQLKKYCDNVGIIFLSTPFDLSSVNELKKLIPAYKISSGDNNYFELIDKVLETKKPILISTGLNNNNEIKKLVNYLKKHNQFKTNLSENLTLLHCVSKYPTPLNEAFLENIKFLKKLNCTVGYSDHTQGIEACLTAVVMGARVIEKHFTIDNNFSKFRDHQLSANPAEFKKMVSSIRNIEILISNKKFELNENIKTNLRRSARYTRNLKSGSFINNQNIKWVRPGNGIINSNKNKILGKKLKVSVLRDQLVELKHIN
tara:strand:+ start:271 stop:1272 length:1002 start_codon:yes stop_codon:yes gene_type:complete